MEREPGPKIPDTTLETLGNDALQDLQSRCQAILEARVEPMTKPDTMQYSPQSAAEQAMRERIRKRGLDSISHIPSAEASVPWEKRITTEDIHPGTRQPK